jgi:hypothetical protein
VSGDAGILPGLAGPHHVRPAVAEVKFTVEIERQFFARRIGAAIVGK